MTYFDRTKSIADTATPIMSTKARAGERRISPSAKRMAMPTASKMQSHKTRIAISFIVLAVLIVKMVSFLIAIGNLNETIKTVKAITLKSKERLKAVADIALFASASLTNSFAYKIAFGVQKIAIATVVTIIKLRSIRIIFGRNFFIAVFSIIFVL